MSDDLNGGPKPINRRAIPISTEAPGGQPAGRGNRLMEFEKFKGIKPSRVLSAIGELQARHGLSQEQALEALLQLERAELQEEAPASSGEEAAPGPESAASSNSSPTVLGTTWSNFKQKLGEWKTDFLQNPIVFAFHMTITNKYFWATAIATSCLVGAAVVYAKAETKLVDFPGKAWHAFGDLFSSLAGAAQFDYLKENPVVAIYGAAAALGFSTFFRPNASAKASRLSLTSALLAAPLVFQDIVEIVQAGTEKTTDIFSSMSSQSYVLAGAAIAAFAASKFLPDRKIRNEEKEAAKQAKAAEKAARKAGKKESWAGAALSTATTSFWWGIYNGMGAVGNAAAKPFSMLGNWLYSIKTKENASPPDSTQAMPIEMMPNPLAGGTIPWPAHGKTCDFPGGAGTKPSPEPKADLPVPKPDAGPAPSMETEEMPAFPPGNEEEVIEEIVD